MKLTKNIWFWAFIIMLILNISTIISVIYFAQKVKAEKENLYQPFQRDRSPGNFLIENLNFSESQTEEFQNIYADHKTKVRSLKSKLRVLNKDLVLELTNEEVSNEKTAEIEAEILQTHKEILKETYFFYENTKSICNDDQISELNAVFRELIANPHRGRDFDRNHRGRGHYNNRSRN